MMSLRLKVFKDCSKLLDKDYKWLTYRYQINYPEFKMPNDPSEDIKTALAWSDIVDKESKGTDAGDCGYAVLFRDEGSSVYKTNIGVLKYNSEINKKLSQDDIDLAISRWESLQDACSKCRIIMRKLHNNNEPIA